MVRACAAPARLRLTRKVVPLHNEGIMRQKEGCATMAGKAAGGPAGLDGA